MQERVKSSTVNACIKKNKNPRLNCLLEFFTPHSNIHDTIHKHFFCPGQGPVATQYCLKFCCYKRSHTPESPVWSVSTGFQEQCINRSWQKQQPFKMWPDTWDLKTEFPTAWPATACLCWHSATSSHQINYTNVHKKRTSHSVIQSQEYSLF